MKEVATLPLFSTPDLRKQTSYPVLQTLSCSSFRYCHLGISPVETIPVLVPFIF